MSVEETYLQISESRLRKWLEAEKKSESEINKTVADITAKKEKIRKGAAKLLRKIRAKYANAGNKELFDLTLRYAAKYGLTSKAEQNVLLKLLAKEMAGVRDSPYLPFEKPHTEMAKFLGISDTPLLDVPSEDRRHLEEMAKLYEQFCGVGKLHDIVKQTSPLSSGNLNAPRTITINAQTFDSNFMNQYVYVNPVIFALYSMVNQGKDSFEKRTIWANFARVVLSRSFHVMKGFVNLPPLQPFEEAQDQELVNAIARDPNSTDFFKRQSPTANLLQRAKIQVALWENVVKLRSSDFYAKTLEPSNAVMNLALTLDQYDLTLFDEYSVVTRTDEVLFLKKILSVFSYKNLLMQWSDQLVPLFNLTGVTNLLPMQQIPSSWGIVALINIPVVVEKTKAVVGPPAVPAVYYTLDELINSSDVIYERKTPVVKARKLVQAQDRIFVTINRYPNNIPTIMLPGLITQPKVPTLLPINQTPIDNIGTIIVNNPPQNFSLKSGTFINNNRCFGWNRISIYQPHEISLATPNIINVYGSFTQSTIDTILIYTP